MPVLPVQTIPRSANLIVSTTGTVNNGITVTLPAVVGQFHFITLIQITKFATAAKGAIASPSLITTTNLPGSIVNPTVIWPVGSPAMTAGQTIFFEIKPPQPIQSVSVNTATTVTADVISLIIWSITVHYYTAPSNLI